MTQLYTSAEAGFRQDAADSVRPSENIILQKLELTRTYLYVSLLKRWEGRRGQTRLKLITKSMSPSLYTG